MCASHFDYMYPAAEAARQYWVLDTDEVEERKEDWISKLFSMEDNDRGSPRTPRGNRRGGSSAPKVKAKAKSKAKVWVFFQNCIPKPLTPKPYTPNHAGEERQAHSSGWRPEQGRLGQDEASQEGALYFQVLG